MLTVRFLNQDDVIACGGADMAAAVQDIENVFALHARGDVVLPSKTVLRWGGIESEYSHGRINAMPAYVGGDVHMAGIKWISGFPKNPFTNGLPRAVGITILNDPDTGVPLAIMDGTLISAVRTGAVTGVAAKYLARPDSEVAGIIGTGVQSRTQLRALKVVLPALKQVKAFDVDRGRRERFAEEMAADLGIEVRPVNSAEEAVRGSQVLVTATTSKEPVVKAEWIEPGLFYSAVGGHEFEYAVADRASKIVVDNWEEIKHRGSQTLCFMHREGLLSDDRIHAELGEVVIGRKAGRQSAGEFILFASVGMGLEDVAVASRVLRTARERGIGSDLVLWREPFSR